MFVHVCGLITLHFVFKTKKSISQLLGTSASRSHSVQSFGRSSRHHTQVPRSPEKIPPPPRVIIMLPAEGANGRGVRNLRI